MQTLRANLSPSLARERGAPIGLCQGATFPPRPSILDAAAALFAAGEEIPFDTGHLAGDCQVRAFIRFYRHFRNRVPGSAEWMHSLLAHVYGPERADSLLRSEGWR